MNRLVGHTVREIYVSKDQHVLTFITDSEPVSFEAWGDCCSESWFADINGTQFLIGAKVISVDQVSMDGYNVEDGRCRQESDSAYGFKVKTDKGDADIVFRNSSNGYYGGDISLITTPPDIDSMKKIESDWRA